MAEIHDGKELFFIFVRLDPLLKKRVKADTPFNSTFKKSFVKFVSLHEKHLLALTGLLRYIEEYPPVMADILDGKELSFIFVRLDPPLKRGIAAEIPFKQRFFIKRGDVA